MINLKNLAFAVWLLSMVAAFYSCQSGKTSRPKVLVFSKTKGWVHTSIPDGIKAISFLGKENGFQVDTTKNAQFFNDETLKNYDAVAFLSTTGDVLNAEQQAAFERYIQAGGGFVGIHSAACTEYEWPWFGNMMGAHFANHPHNPGVRKATVLINDKDHPATAHLPKEWVRDDEWYNYKSFYPGIKVLASLDETTYVGGIHGSHHPIAWYQEFDGGRSFYTGGGHESEAFKEPLFLSHLLGGIKYAMGTGDLDYSKATALETPEENRFVKETLVSNLKSPMELAVSDDGRIFFTELKGGLHIFHTKTGKYRKIHQFEVETVGGTGLIGIALDPEFVNNQYIYLYYAPSKIDDSIYFKLSRFTVKDDVLDTASEKILLKVNVSENSGSHHGGSLAWDKEGNLYLSTGGSTSPFASNGYAPLDERPGEEFYSLDEQRSSSNTHDLKGKILRIHPEEDGSYTIPSGNLFPPGTEKTLPEIYVMGCRNPYRMTVNKETGAVYWGDIGPDAGNDGERGPMGYDEFNQAKEAGNYGWPYFIADNQAYADWNFETQTAGPKFNPEEPANNSPNNTGISKLPPAQPAMIWYPYTPSSKFPQLGEGGRSAMVGDFYHYDQQSTAESAFPQYYDGSLFVFDWMRNWVMSLKFDADENFQSAEPFMPLNGDFRRPIDLAFDKEGAMYMLEYGSVYGVDNEDARLVQITYNKGNRYPVAKAAVLDVAAEKKLHRTVFLTSELRTLQLRKTIAGQVPLKVNFTSRGSGDPDTDDKLVYEWQFDGKTISEDANPMHTYTTPGVYKAILTVTDSKGMAARDTITVLAGNTPPAVRITSSDNKSFYWENTPFEYRVEVSDKEDGNIDQERLKISFDYQPKAATMKEEQDESGNQMLPLGAVLISESDCEACHTANKTAVGPSYTSIVMRYKNEPNVVASLSQKIINGGSGKWGQSVMSAHPQLSSDDVKEMVKYILSIADEETKKEVPSEGRIVLDRHTKDEERGFYILTASYTDNGANGIQQLSGKNVVRLRKAKIRTAFADEHIGFERYRNSLGAGGNADYILFRNIDLSGINKFVYELSSQEQCAIVVRIDSRAGRVIASTSFDATGEWDELSAIEARVEEPVSGFHDVYFIIDRPESPNEEFMNFQNISFEP